MISSISRRLFVAFACIVVLLGTQGILTVIAQRYLVSETQRLNQSCDDAQQLVTILQQMHTDVSVVIGTRNPATMDAYLQRYRQDLKQGENLVAHLGLSGSDFDLLVAGYEQAISMQYQFAFELANQALGRSLPMHEIAVDRVNRRLEVAEAQKAETLRQVSNRMRFGTLVLGLLAIGTALFWAWYLQRFFTDRKRAETNLAQALRKLQNVLDSATQVAIIMTDRNGLVQVFNRGAEYLLGWSSAEVVNLKTPLLWHDSDEAEERRKELEAEGYAVPSCFEAFTIIPLQGQSERRQWTFVTRSGERRRVDLVVTRVLDEQENIIGFLGVATDITQQVEAEAALRAKEEQIRQSQKMDAIGQLAGGVAHDFNNMLSGILGSAELLASEFPPGDRRASLVNIIVAASQRASDLTKKLLAFSRKGKLLSTSFSLHRIIEDAVLLLQRSIDRGIEIQVDLCPEDPSLVGDPSQIENALLNLCINARDAMPGGGLLRIQTSLCDRPDGPFVELNISDTGTGIPLEIQSRIFEPFFTTKPQGKGTGLGLAAVYGIVQDHRGLLKLDSTPGQGTTFRLWFPVERLGATMPSQAPLVVHQGKGAALIIDDEDLVRTTLSMLLESAGYQILSAANGLDGLKLFQERRQDITFVFLDLVMPGISGKETFQRIKALDPEARIIVASGFSSEGSVSDLQEKGLRVFMHKPFTKNELMEAVTKVLS